MDSDVAILIKSDSIKVDSTSSMIVMYYYHLESYTDEKGHKHTIKDKSFYRCAARLESNETWNEIAEGLSNDNPAERFSLKMLGLSDDLIMKTRKTWTKANASHWIKLKLSRNKLHSLEEFLNGHVYTTGQNIGAKTPGAFETDLPYLRNFVHEGQIYSLEEPSLFPRGLWLSATRIAPPRKSPKIIKD